MYRLRAGMCLSAMLFALFAAPLFHVHERSSHSDAEVTLHAHVPDSEHAVGHSDEPEIESRHSHGNVRWIDILTLNSPLLVGLQLVAEASEALAVVSPASSRVAITFVSLHLHGPPVVANLAPRSPPSL